MAGQTHTMTRSFSGSGVTFNKATATVGNMPVIFDQSVPIGTNTQYLLPIKRSKLLAMVLTASTDVTIKTNSTGSPDDTIVLTAGLVYDWDLARDTLTAGPGLVACPISVDIGANGIYITAAAISVVKICALLGV